jgi:hypothetical protein
LKNSGKIGACSVADNAQPAYNGSYARLARTGTGTVTFPGYGNETVIPNGFFDSSTVAESPDVDADPTNGTITVTESKPYIIMGRIKINGGISSLCAMNLQRYKASTSTWSTVQSGTGTDGVPGGGCIQGQWVQYLEAGDKVRLSTFRSGLSNSNELTGESTGGQTFFTLTGAG